MTKHEKKIDQKQFQKILNLELATVFEMGQLCHRYDLINAYLAVGMQREAMNELNRIAQVNPDDPDVLAKQLLILAEQRSFRKLSQFMMRQALKVKEPSPSLTLALAQSFSLVGCREEATKHYDKYLRAKDVELTPKILGQLSEFIAKGPMSKELAQILIQLSKNETESSSDRLWNYILTRLYTDAHNYFLADNYLTPLVASEIDNKYVAFDLSLVIFRLADLKRSIEMAERTLELDPDFKPAQVFLVSVYSFLGDIEKASSILKRYGLSSPELSLSQRQINAIVEYVLHGKHPMPCSNTIVVNPSDANDFRRNFSHRNGDKNYVNEQSDVVTVSCFGSGLDERGNPWEILMSLDRRYPHIMVQKYKECLRLHGFIASRDSVLWPWQEVAISICMDERSFDISIEHLKALEEKVTRQDMQNVCDKLHCFEDELLQNPFLVMEEKYE